MANDRLENGKTEVLKLMALIEREFRTGQAARDDLAFREVIRNTVWRYNNHVRDHVPTICAMTSPETEGALVTVDEATAELHEIRANAIMSSEWALSAHAGIQRMLDALEPFPKNVFAGTVRDDGTTTSGGGPNDRSPGSSSRGGSAIVFTVTSGGGPNAMTAGGDPKV